jgi:4-hydroxybenzoate polyprenyltransferase
MKNTLIFVPLLAAHQLTNPSLMWQSLLAFLFFGLCASSVYLLNDLLDLADDRHHHSKRNRPFAAGRLSIKSGLIAFPVLLVMAVGGVGFVYPWASYDRTLCQSPGDLVGLSAAAILDYPCLDADLSRGDA